MRSSGEPLPSALSPKSVYSYCVESRIVSPIKYHIAFCRYMFSGKEERPSKTKSL